ncbi:GNAT family N-acetyltransferase [Mesonia sp. MT50]|uniref:GNAT family N-acetyltransferase n=1 Tax=Mesonia profundi TaxID=3070998 RepID=A0ABU1A1I8_9FLAO|nr:GNAT family N-acetyltransferase [Mesonia profundi]MDQ7917489.1 GNAT family N-acetyltransferase [Mesonia profundi]
MNIEIKEVDVAVVLSIRQEVLRNGKPIRMCKMQGDELPSSIHLGLFYENKLAGITSLMVEAHPEFPDLSQLRLRGMAVLPEFQKKKLGKLLMEEAISVSQKKHADILWFNAREAAVGFYEKFGFSVRGNLFNIKDVGDHFLMYKEL